MTDTDDRLHPFEVEVEPADVDDLRRRLRNTIWPDQLDDTAWVYGTDLDTVRSFCEEWAERYDWDGFVVRANAHPQVLTQIDGERIHAIHARSPEPDALPLIITHGWPGSVAELWDVIDPLTDPRAHGGDPADAFHVVAPSLPGYGFSGPTRSRGIDVAAAAERLHVLMGRLGYDRFVAQGGDWGSVVTTRLAHQQPDRVLGIHLNMLVVPAPPEEERFDGLDDADLAQLARGQQFRTEGTGYQAIQGTRPQTLAYGLTDSPAGLAAWILEKFHAWSDCGGDLDSAFDRTRLLDNLSIYWLTRTINSSMRLYYETIGLGGPSGPVAVTVPTGHARYPGEIYLSPRAWAERWYPIVHWVDMPRGGHFAAMEQPELFVDDVRAFARRFRA